jgi:hypothetical protein
MATYTNQFTSTNVDNATWDDETGQLEVTFARDGSTHTYFNVPRSVWEQFVLAPSAGRFLLQNLKGNYG